MLRDVVADLADVTVVEADAMTLDWAQLLGGDERVGARRQPARTTWRRRWSRDLLDGVPRIGRMLVMVQREVGERLVAGPGYAGLRRVSA